MAWVVKRIAKRAARLARPGELEALEPDVMDRVRAKSGQGELALREVAGEVRPARLFATKAEFSLQAARHLHENDRAGLAFLVRYNLRPPLALTRMRELPSGKIYIQLKAAAADGMIGMELEPVALLRRLASLVPPRGSHDIAYYGIFAAHGSHRGKFVKAARLDPDDCHTHPAMDTESEEIKTVDGGVDPSLEGPPARCLRWADLMKKIHGLDVLACPCGGRRKVMEEVKAVEFAEARGRPRELFEEPPRDYDGVDPPSPDEFA